MIYIILMPGRDMGKWGQTLPPPRRMSTLYFFRRGGRGLASASAGAGCGGRGGARIVLIHAWPVSPRHL